MCRYDPRATRLDEGAHACPECGMMVVAGCPHPIPQGEVYAPIDRTTYDQLRPYHDRP